MPFLYWALDQYVCAQCSVIKETGGHSAGQQALSPGGGKRRRACRPLSLRGEKGLGGTGVHRLTTASSAQHRDTTKRDRRYQTERDKDAEINTRY